LSGIKQHLLYIIWNIQRHVPLLQRILFSLQIWTYSSSILLYILLQLQSYNTINNLWDIYIEGEAFKFSVDEVHIVDSNM